MCSIKEIEPKRPWKRSADGRAPRVLNLPRYATYFFTVIANQLSNGASRRYLREFGIGIFEWRILAMLAIEPRITANRICEVIGFDKAAVSRGTKTLRQKGLITSESVDGDQRLRRLELTRAGYKLHDQMIGVALDRERRLLRDLAPNEVDQLLDLLRRIADGLPLVNETQDDADPVPATLKNRRASRGASSRGKPIS
jgi:DNA-binding MarR family transcriptional regulator